MTAADRLLEGVVAWAAREPNVRRVVLVGSRARTASTDDLADIDLQIYAQTSVPYLEDDRWPSRFGETWACIRDEYRDGEVQVPTRLVIFEGGRKVDFAFYPAGALSAGIRSGLPHRILVDKDPSATPSTAVPDSASHRAKPSAAEFGRVVEEFWFEAYHVAKYLARNELWLAKGRDWAAKQSLLAMMGWHEQFTHGHAMDPDCQGRRGTISAETWQALDGLFSGFRREESWDAAFATTTLFRRLARDTAAALGYVYPADLDRNLSGFMMAIRRRQPR